ncbi:glycogen-binding domain-containing protein [Candidatus Margulisiibacteriota bacterium]
MAVKKTTKTTTKAKPTTKKTNGKNTDKQVTFKWQNSEISAVSLVGDFNNWNPKKNTMKKAKSGTHSAKVSLKPGRYAYKFLDENGSWHTDPNAECVWDENGNQNSYIEVA